MNFIYIDQPSLMTDAQKILDSAEELGIDIECENNLHHYGSYVSLIQVSDRDHNWVIDVLKLHDISKFIAVLSDQKTRKIFHDVSFDFRIINHQFKCSPKNIFDTQLASIFLGKKDISLNSLLQEYFHFEKQKKFQKTDWTRRPLTAEMLEYAAADSYYLIRLKAILEKSLAEKGRLEWVKEEFSEIEKVGLEYKEGGFWDIKGIKLLSDRERAILKRLYDIREQMAQKVDRPVHFIINTKQLIHLAIHPVSQNEFRDMRGVHPIVRRNASLFYDAINQGKKETVSMPGREKRHFEPAQRELFKELTEKRDGIADKLGIEGYLIMDKDQMIDIVLSGNYSCLRPWQRKLIDN